MKKPKDVTDLADRLASAASTPLVAPAPVAAPVVPAPVALKPTQAARAAGKRKGPNRSTVAVYLRLSQSLYEQCDEEAVRRTKATGRGVTVQQVILSRLERTTA